MKKYALGTPTLDSLINEGKSQTLIIIIIIQVFPAHMDTKIFYVESYEVKVACKSPQGP
jgi:hypothetical protein